MRVTASPSRVPTVRAHQVRVIASPGWRAKDKAALSARYRKSRQACQRYGPPKCALLLVPARVPKIRAHQVRVTASPGSRVKDKGNELVRRGYNLCYEGYELVGGYKLIGNCAA